MSGFFVVGEKKERPGVYKRYENAGGVEAAHASGHKCCDSIISGTRTDNVGNISALVNRDRCV